MVDFIKNILQKQKLNEDKVKVFAKSIMNAYVSFLSTLKGTESYEKIESSYDNCLSLLRLSLCKALDIPYFDTVLFDESLIDSCSEYLLNEVDFDLNLGKQAVNQVCVLVAGGIRRGLNASR